MDEQTQEKKTPDKKQKSSMLKHILFGVLIFICGIIVGLASSAIIIHEGIKHVIGHKPPEISHVVNRLDQKLDLSDEQKQSISVILYEEFEKIGNTKYRFFRSIQDHIKTIQSRVSDELNDDQQEEWNEDVEHFQKMFSPNHADINHPEHTSQHD